MRRVSNKRVVAAVTVVILGLSISPGSGQNSVIFPFVLPWDDASSGPTDLSGWNRPIESEADRLRIGPDGRLYRGSDRFRIFGFSMAGGAQFPDRSSAEKIAARLAKFGINYVRIDQMSRFAPNGWFDPATRGRGLHAEALDRLDYFIAQLRRRGIYVHLTLTTNRCEYPPEVPGFESASWRPEGWPYHCTGITQFFTPVIEQNRAVARQVLTHRNPYTGLTYAQDPAIAVIEVTNEDGLTRLWQAGEIDPLITSDAAHLRPLRDELRARWNRWLRERYPSEERLRAAWDQGAHASGAELLTNGDFRQGTQGWRFVVEADARAQRQVVSGTGPLQGGAVLQVQVDRAGAENWHVRMTQSGLSLRQGQAYRVAFWARAAKPGAKLAIYLQETQPLRTVVWREFTLSDQWQEMVFTAVPATSARNVNFHVILGFESLQIFWLGRISLQEASAVGVRENESLAQGTIPLFSSRDVGLRTAAAQRDWVAFLFDAETRFFAEEMRVLKDELQVKSLVVGTQLGFSPMTVQAILDAASVHDYWGGRTFPGQLWDPGNWFVRNSAMVNARDEWHTVNRIAFRRIVGKPLIVDEYNHFQPNTFVAEGLPLIAAYGAFQDWDGVVIWTYGPFRKGRFLTQDDWATLVSHNWDQATGADPVRMLGAWLAAVVLRRGDIVPGAQHVTVGLTKEQEQEIARTIGLWRSSEEIGRGAATVPLRHRVGVQIGGPIGIQVAASSGREPIVTDTGEIAWDTRRERRGVVTVNTPRTRMVIGFGGGMEFTLGDVTLQPGPTSQQGFGVWAIVALDGSAPIGRARRLIIVALGYSQNTNMGWKIYPDRRIQGLPPEGVNVTVGREWGGPPVLVEGVPARIVLPATSERVQAWVLDERGQRKGALDVRLDRGRPVLEISPAHRTLWYEVAVGGQ